MGNSGDGIKMKTMNNLQSYIPDEPFLGPSVLYLRCSDGNDWYASQGDFSPDTVKIAFDARGIICAMSTDISRLWPVGLSVTEIDASAVPADADANGEWLFDGEKISLCVTEVAIRKKASLLAEAGEKISLLQDRVDVGDASADESNQLLAWKKYRILLNAIDTSLPDITWPEIPA